jgi:hypothetical protein
MPPETPSGRSSGVEHDLAKVGVEGSNPFARSNFKSLKTLSFFWCAGARGARCPTPHGERQILHWLADFRATYGQLTVQKML